MEYKTNILINKKPEDVFAVLAALDRFNDWLPASTGYMGTDLTSDLPVREGSTYNLNSPQGIRAGVVETFEPSKHLVFKEIMNLPIGGKITITIEYTLSPEGDGTKLERHIVFDVPMMILPMLKAQEPAIQSGTELYMQAIKAEVEKA